VPAGYDCGPAVRNASLSLSQLHSMRPTVGRGFDPWPCTTSIRTGDVIT